MKITKYPQSCLKIEIDGTTLVIDPGNLVNDEDYKKALENADAILITHEHADHVDPVLIERLSKSVNKIIANQSTADLLNGEFVNQIVKDSDVFNVNEVEITAIELPHFKLNNGTDGPQNTGYLIAGSFFHPGDSLTSKIEINNGAVPIAGPNVDNDQIFKYIEKSKLKNIIPIHNDYFHQDAVLFGNTIEVRFPEIKYINLDNGQSALV